MLSYAGMYSHAQQVFLMMAGRTSSISPTSTSSSSMVWKWKPGTFTIAQLVRAAREANLPLLAKDAIDWGVTESTFIPQGVISDSVSLVYGQGRTDLATEIYQRLYGAGLVNHWASPLSSSSSSSHSPATGPPDINLSAPLVLDLHGFSRGMSFAAINTAINEVHKKGQESRLQIVTLEIITGRGIGREGLYRNVQSEEQGEGGDEVEGTYILTNEVQRSLIEDFYPPLPSSTVPNNPGRLQVQVQLSKNLRMDVIFLSFLLPAFKNINAFSRHRN